MFEFSIKSSKNIKELNIVFEDSDTISDLNIPVETSKQYSKGINETKELKPSKKEQSKNTESKDFLNFDNVSLMQSSNTTIIPKPEIPDIKIINVADELHNLDF